jgi:hypothetical protein
LVQHLTGLKTCPCGSLYVDTQVGKSAHHAWCDALAEGLASSAPMLESALGSVVIQQITGISTVASDGTVVRMKAHAYALTSHDWGSTGSLHGVDYTIASTSAARRRPRSPLLVPSPQSTCVNARFGASSAWHLEPQRSSSRRIVKAPTLGAQT